MSSVPGGHAKGEPWTEYAFLESAIREIPDGVLIVDAASGRLLLSNRRLEDLLARPLSRTENLLREGAIPLLDEHGEPIRPEDTPLGRVVRDAVAVIDQFCRVRLQDGSLRALTVSANPVTDHAGELVAAVAVFRDVTQSQRANRAMQDYRDHLENRVRQRTEELEYTNQALRAEMSRRRQVESDLRQSEARYRSLVHQIPAVTYIASIGDEVSITYVSPQVRTMLGYSPSEFYLDASLHMHCVQSEDRRHVREAYRTLEDVGDQMSIEYRMVSRDGSTVWVSDETVVVQREDSGKLVVQGLAMDVTARHEAEERMRASEQRFAQFMKHLPGAAYIKDRSGRFLYANEYMLRRFIPRGADAGIDGVDALEDVLGGPLGAEELQVLNSGIPEEVDEEVTFDGVTTAYLMRRFPIFRPDGPPLLGVIAIDITERKQAQERIRRYQGQLRQLARRAADAEQRERRHIATELHDQMAQVLALTKMKVEALADVRRPSVDSQSLDDIASKLNDCITYTRSLVFDLSPPVLYEVGLAPALERLAEQICLEHALSCRFADDGTEKPLDQEVSVALYGAARELMVNVIKHARANTMDVSVARQDGHVRVTVADDGIGIGKSDNETAPEAGSGFGLFSIRERIALLGGSLRVITNPEGGTQATLSAPLKNPPESSQESHQS